MLKYNNKNQFNKLFLQIIPVKLTKKRFFVKIDLTILDILPRKCPNWDDSGVIKIL